MHELGRVRLESRMADRLWRSQCQCEAVRLGRHRQPGNQAARRADSQQSQQSQQEAASQTECSSTPGLVPQAQA